MGKIANMFSQPMLELYAASAAEELWGIVPRGTMEAAGVANAAAAAAATPEPLPPLLLAGAKYAPSLMYTHWMEEQAAQRQVEAAATGSADRVQAAMSFDGSLDAYLYGDNMVDSGTRELTSAAGHCSLTGWPFELGPQVTAHPLH